MGLALSVPAVPEVAERIRERAASTVPSSAAVTGEDRDRR
jgi:hypothetical protein